MYFDIQANIFMPELSLTTKNVFLEDKLLKYTL